MDATTSSLGLLLLLLAVISPIVVAVEALLGKDGVLNREKASQDSDPKPAASEFSPLWSHCPKCNHALESRWSRCPKCGNPV
jgi:hypothetical protein